MSIPMNRWSPKGIGISAMPIDPGWQNRREMTAQARFSPISVMPFPDLASGLIAITPAHARHGHALLGKIGRVIAKKEIEELLLLIEHDREISISAREIVIPGVAFKSAWRRVENDAQKLLFRGRKWRFLG